MPKIFMPVPEVNESVSRPVIIGIAKDLLKMADIPQDTVISFPGDSEKQRQPGSEYGQEAAINTLPFTNKLTIEVDENYEQERLNSTAVYGPENLFIFKDDKIETYIKPVYSSSDVTINFKYRAIDKPSAIRWRDTIRARVSMMWDMRLHSADYHYLIPEELLVILKELHRMREAVDGYGDTYEQYFETNSTKRLTKLSTLIGSHPTYGIVEKQMRIGGYFDFDGVPEVGSKEDEADTWTISFSYKLKYDKPIGCVMFYPLVVHNQLVDQKFRPNPITDAPDPLDAADYAYTQSALNFSMFEKTNNVYHQLSGISIPLFDEFLPLFVPNNTVRLFTVLINIDQTNPTFLMSLRDLGDVSIRPEILNFLVGEVPFIFRSGGSVFKLDLYRDHDLIENGCLTMDANLNIYSTSVLSLRNYYHIRLSLVNDFTALQVAAVDRLRNNASVAQMIISALGGSVIPGTLGNSNYITKAAMQAAIDAMNASILTKGNMQDGYQAKTVETMFVSASLSNN